jgi:hypothetical protein
MSSILGGKFGSIVLDRNTVPLEEWWLKATDLLDVARHNPVKATT